MTPDLTTLGKIIGGGSAGRRVSAAVSISCIEIVSPSGPVYQAGTMSGHPLAMAAGLATLSMHRRATRRSTTASKHSATRSRPEWTPSSNDGTSTCRLARVGSMWTLFFTDAPVTDWATAARARPRPLRTILPCDAAPGHLAGAIAIRGQFHLDRAHTRRHRRHRRRDRTWRWRRAVAERQPRPDAGAATAGSVADSLFLRACRQQPVPRTPTWIMRQAGRYLPEYRGAARTPRLPDVVPDAGTGLRDHAAAGAPSRRRRGDSLLGHPGPAAGHGRATSRSIPGPHLWQRRFAPRTTWLACACPTPRESTGYVLDAVRLISRELDGRVPLIGFAGAPFTMATYLVEGGGSKQFGKIKGMLFADPALAHRLLDRSARARRPGTCRAQVDAGADAAMLFDTWAGSSVRRTTRRSARRTSSSVFDQVRRRTRLRAGRDVPRIYYAGDAAGWLDQVPAVGATVAGLDWRLNLDRARAILGPAMAVQGNLDPAVLLAPPDVIHERAGRVLRSRPDLSATSSISVTASCRRRRPITRAGSWTASRNSRRGARRERAARHSRPLRLVPRPSPRQASRPNSNPRVALIRRYDKPGPRYTSYPTAVQFNDSFDEPAYRARLAEAATVDDALSLYLHLPVLRGALRVLRMLGHHHAASTTSPPTTSSTCIASWQCWPPRSGADAASCSTTGAAARRPTCRSTEIALAPRGRAPRTSTSIRRRKSPSKSTRASRRSRSSRCCARWASTGCRWACRTSRRRYRSPSTASSREDGTRALLDEARRLGFQSINVDLIYGLPFQTAGVLRRRRRRRHRDASRSRGGVLVRARAVDPRESEAHQPGATCRRANARSSCFVERWSDSVGPATSRSAWTTSRCPTTSSRRRSRQGRLHRNFMGYTTRPAPDMVAAGVSGIGDVRGAFAQNVKKLSTYYEAIDAGRFPIERGYRLDRDDQIRRHVITELMCNFRVEIQHVESRFGIGFHHYFAQRAPRAGGRPRRRRLREPVRHAHRCHAGRPDLRAQRRDGLRPLPARAHQ